MNENTEKNRLRRAKSDFLEQNKIISGPGREIYTYIENQKNHTVVEIPVHGIVINANSLI